MTDRSHLSPPRWLDRLLEWYCKPELLEDLQGDLHEYYQRNLAKGKFRADWVYFMDVLKFFRLYTLRKPKVLMRITFFTLLDSYFKTSVRSIARNKLFSTINVAGLAISMSVGLLMIAYLSELLSFDTFHERADRIYRVQTNYREITDDESAPFASTSVFIGKELQKDYPGIEALTLLERDNMDVDFQSKKITAEVLWASEEFFDIFSFKLVAGNPATALKDPHSVVITESLAQKLFGEADPIGLVVQDGSPGKEGNKELFTITGLVEDPPANSHIEFEALASFSTLEKDQENIKSFKSYNNIWQNYVYILLSENELPETIQAHLDTIAQREGRKYDRYSIDYDLVNLLDILPGKGLYNQIGPEIEWKVVYLLAALSLIVLISACFNYTNLSIARSLRRAREVGIRKVVGAGRLQLFAQFSIEAMIIALLALLLSGGMYVLLRPYFIALVLHSDPVTLTFRPEYLAYFVVFALVTGFMAGFLPSMLLSGLGAKLVLKDASRLKLMNGVTLRKVLVVFQFALSIGFISAAVIENRQYQYALDFDLGYDTDNVLNIRLQGNDKDLLKAEFSKLPGVLGLSESGLVMSLGSSWGNQFKYNDPMDSVKVDANYIDTAYLALHDFRLLAGGNFPHNLRKDEPPRYVIISRKLSDRFGFKDPHDAIGEKIQDYSKNKLEVVGVVEDFHQRTLSDPLTPFVFLQDPGRIKVLNLKIHTEHSVELIGQLEAIWKEVDEVHPFEAEFFDDRIQKTYEQYLAYSKIVGFLAFLAVTIATLGLLGMAVFTTETRLKEISVRKVLGATEQQLVYLLSKGFFRMLLVAGIIAVPVTYWVVEQVIFSDLVYHSEIHLLELFSGVIIIFAIGGLTVGWQTSRAARANPADLLRDE